MAPNAELPLGENITTGTSEPSFSGTGTGTDTDEAEFEPINANDRENLASLAGQFENSEPLMRTLSQVQSNALERFDSRKANFGDAVVDPKAPQFEVYKWARVMLRLMDDKGIKRHRSGVVFRDLEVYGSGEAINIQQTVGSIVRVPAKIHHVFKKSPKRQILHNFFGFVKKGELLVVLGRPGSGCSTLLKSMTGELHGLKFGPQAVVHYNGITQETMHKHFRGEVIYTGEVDQHFPHLTVGETLEFAAAARTPQTRAFDGSRKEWIRHITQVIMAVFGLSHTYYTKVGNDYVRGVSGGERKRVTIAEAALAGSPVMAWDNSTRGLDSATALKFVKSLRMSASLGESCHSVAIYQASQAIYDEFDKATILYEGRQIYFGPANRAKAYFEDMGWYCPPRETTGDFLTSVTNPEERVAREGMENKVPRTAEEFQKYWFKSPEYANLQQQIATYEKEYPIGGQDVLNEFKESRKAMQSRHIPSGSPYTISVPMQIKLCLARAFQRLWNDKTSTVTTVVAQALMSLIIGSIFYGMPDTTDSFSQKGGLLFFATLLNALIAIIEINDLYDQRPIVEKHASYAFYKPWTEAFAGVIANIPIKFVTSVCFNIILYFLSGLRMNAGSFFIFFLFTFLVTLTMSTIFRCTAAATKTLTQAHALSGVLVLALIVYTGYIIPRLDMHPWFKWISWINPLAYAFESLLLNEMHGRNFPCTTTIPPYPNLSGDTFICPVVGAVAGQTFVSGDAWMEDAFGYSYNHLWRNLGFIFAFTLFFLALYLLATELNSVPSGKGEVLVFRRGHVPKSLEDSLRQAPVDDEKAIESGAVGTPEVQNQDVYHLLEPQTEVFTWRNVAYDIKVKDKSEGTRRLLNDVSGWVKPGTLTALMGVSGAGKTTLLDVLAQRTSIGVVHGDFLVSGKHRDASFQRKTGYVQQQDLHLPTSTVREALRFSAFLRQPKSVSKEEKWEHVENVIKVLDMEDFAEAIVGVPGEGLNVHQRKLLTIGVELAAKPGLLIFLDEPTSGLDSQSSWSIISVLRKLADSGQAVLSTIHQPSSTLFQQFDRLLFLGAGGKTIYFGEVGENSRTLLDYFEARGARKCADSENPAEYMLEVCGEEKNIEVKQNWHELWKSSNECQAVYAEIDRIHAETGNKEPKPHSHSDSTEFAMPFLAQLQSTTIRVFQQYWRTPSYVMGKIFLAILSSLFIGFSFFNIGHSIQGIQNAIFGLFMVATIFNSMAQQIMPEFITQRALYEIRERPSKTYSWKAFLLANMIVEVPYQLVVGLIVFACFYYPTFGVQSSSQQGTILLFLLQFFVYAAFFAHLIIVALPDASTAGSISTILFSMCLIFNGVFQTPTALPGFWIFMYRVSPVTYVVAGMATTALHDRPIICAENEISIFNPPANATCGAYMQQFLTQAPGQLLNPNATTGCEYCALSVADQYIAEASMYYDQRWRDYGIIFAYIGFNTVAIVALYYLFRVHRWRKNKI